MKRRELIFLIVGWALYFIIKGAGPLWVAHLYSEKSFAFLNGLSANSSPETLDFYQGRIQETFFGPACQMLSYWLLACILCRHFRHVSAKIFGLIIFIFLVVTKFAVLNFPPYGDAIGGPFAEALWLCQHGFDYAGLFNQPNFTVGGPRVYVFSLYPGFLALTLKMIPAPKVFFVFHHLLTFAAVSAIVAMLRECGRKVFDPVVAILMSLLMLALPLIQSQTEAINMEIPVAFFTMLSAYSLISKRWKKAALWASLAAAIKGIGVIACGPAVFFLSVEAVRHNAVREKWKLIGWALLPAVTGTFIVSAKFLFHDSHIQQGMVRWDAGWPSVKKEFIFYLFLAASLIFIFDAVKNYVRRGKKEFLAPVVMLLFCMGWFVLFINFYAVSPRYRVALYPFLIFLVVYGATLVLKWKTFQRVLLAGALSAACLMSYGLFYGSVSENDHVLLERSLEYRNDLELNRRLVKAAEERYNDKLIVAPFTIAQALATPELGYVHSKLKVMIYGFPLKYGDIANYPGLQNLNLRKTVFVGVKIAPINPEFSFPVGPNDVIIEELAVGNKKASFFMGGYSIEALWRFTRGMGLKGR